MLTTDGQTVQYDNEIANALNNYFSNIGNELSERNTNFKSG